MKTEQTVSVCVVDALLFKINYECVIGGKLCNPQQTISFFFKSRKVRIATQSDFSLEKSREWHQKPKFCDDRDVEQIKNIIKKPKI